MDREINLDSILALEKQIVEHERATIRLKRVDFPPTRDPWENLPLERHPG